MNVITLIFVAVYVSQLTFVNGVSYSTFINDTSTPTEENTASLTPKQSKLVQEFRVVNSKILIDDYLRSNSHIVGWLRANRWDTTLASKALKRSLAWRVFNKIDVLGEKPAQPKMLQLFPYRIIGRSKDGCPVLEADMGRWDIVSYMSSAEFARDSVNGFKEHLTQMWEKTRMAVKENANVCDQAIFLQDETGFSMKHFGSAYALGGTINALTLLETQYPNMFREMHLGNAPADFAVIMTIVKSAFNSGTVAGIKIYSQGENSEFYKGVMSTIDPASVPPQYGGTRAI